jgi:steroid delta-isomerase-like uncharacterized protein
LSHADQATFSAVVVIGLCLGLAATGAIAAPTQIESNKAVAKRYLEALGTKQFSSVARSVQARDHKQLRYEFQNLKYNADNSELARTGKQDFTAIPDRSNAITRLLGEGDMVAATIHVTGTHKANFYGIPASGKSFDFDEVAIFRLANGKISETFLMADEARFLRQIGSRLPTRKDGKLIAPPIPDDTRLGDAVVAELLAHPQDTAEYRHKLQMASYKAKTKPADYVPAAPDKGYLDPSLRSGNQDTVDLLKEIKAATGKDVPGSFGAAWSGREDRIGFLMAEGNQGMMQFRLNALNAGPLYTIPASNKQIMSWEVCFAEFVGDTWKTAWFFGDEMGMFLQIGGHVPQDFFFNDAKTPR